MCDEFLRWLVALDTGTGDSPLPLPSRPLKSN